MRMTGAQAAIEILREQRTAVVFGYPGANVLEIYRALAASDIRHILTSSEAGAAHAADGFSRAGGGVGVCIATSGPGATNLATGIATAYMDSTPVVFITGNVPRAQVGTDSFQEVDITGITLPITKWNMLVRTPDELVDSLRTAFRIAREGRPGPVLVDIPRDVALGVCEYSPKPPEVLCPKAPSDSDMSSAASLIERSQRPIILAGGGAKTAPRELESFRARLDCPLVTTMMGIGASPHSLGFVGQNGHAAANAALDAADLVIAVGARFSDRVARPFEDRLNLVHIDVDRAEIGKNVAAAASVEADASLALKALTPLVTPKPWSPPTAAEKRIAARGGVSPRSLSTVRRYFPDALVATDVGEHQIWATRFIGVDDPRGLLTPGGLGTMGFGLGAAVGGCVATGRRAVLVTGDGSFMMNLNELATAVREGVDLTVLLMRNRALGMVHRKLRRGERAVTELKSQPDFLRLARSFGAKAWLARSDSELERRLETASKTSGVKLIECRVGRDTHIG